MKSKQQRKEREGEDGWKTRVPSEVAAAQMNFCSLTVLGQQEIGV